MTTLPHSTTTPRPSPERRPAPMWCRLWLALAAALSGCIHIGPHTVTVDRLDYGAAIADSWKQQTLLNIVKLRYMDLPVFLDVASVVSGYSLQTSVGLSGEVFPNKAATGDSMAARTDAIYIDRPTITYAPLTGEKFLRGLLAPINPTNIFFLLQSGYPADFILALTVESLNGLRNRSTAAGSARVADPEFARLLELLREVQAAGAFGLCVEEEKTQNATAIVFLKRDNESPEIAAKGAEILRLLRLPDYRETFRLVYSPMRGNNGELAVSSRSMIQIMAAFASCADVPEEDVREERAVPVPEAAPRADGQPGVRIHSSQERPDDAYAAVRYRDRWFWIADRDWYSKRALTAIMFFFTLADTGDNAMLPLVTIPAQ